MKRRGFFGALFGLSAAPAVTFIAAHEQPEGVLWTTACPLCKHMMSQFVELGSKPVWVGTQCSQCLAVLDTSGLAEQIYAAQGKDKYGRLRA